MRGKNWTQKMRLRVSQLTVKMMVSIKLKIYAGKDVPGKKMKMHNSLYLILHHLLFLTYSPYHLVASHLRLCVTGVWQVAKGSALDDVSLPQGVITTMAARTNHPVQQSVLKCHKQYPVVTEWICSPVTGQMKPKCL
jgi:hypothetical protein